MIIVASGLLHGGRQLFEARMIGQHLGLEVGDSFFRMTKKTGLLGK
jgi:hypothetical protein